MIFSKSAARALAAGLALLLAGCAATPAIEVTQTPPPAAPTPPPAPEPTPLPANYHEVETAGPDAVTLAFVGDVNFADDWNIMENFTALGGSFENRFSDDLLEILRGADIFMANNEFSISDRGEPMAGKAYTFRAQPGNIAYWQTLGVDLLGLANNHVGDYGLDALTDTLDNLAAAGLPAVGAGRTLAEAQQAQYFIANGMTLAFVAATRAEKNIMTPRAAEDSSGALYAYDPAETVAAVETAAVNADFVVAYLHWGTEESTELEQAQLDLATACAEAGADLIVGAHPHVLQGAGWRGDVPVFYSLGNFWFNMDTDNTAVLRVTLRGDGNFTCEILPCQQDGGTTRLLTDEIDRQWVLTEMNGAMEAGAALDGDGVLIHSGE